MFKDVDRRHRAEKLRHIEPPRVEAVIEQHEGGIKSRDHCNDKACRKEYPQPLHAAGSLRGCALDHRDNAGHREQRQEQRHTAPFGVRLFEHDGARRDFPGEEHSLKDKSVALVFIVEQEIPAVQH